MEGEVVGEEVVVGEHVEGEMSAEGVLLKKEVDEERVEKKR